MKNLLTCTILTLSLLSLQACNAYVYSDTGWHRGGHSDYNRGRDHRRDRRDGRRHRRGGGHHMMTSNSLLAPTLALSERSNNSISLLSQEYNVQFSSAAKIIKFAQGNGNIQNLKAIGLTLQDVKPIENLEMPSEEAIQKIATKLNESNASIEAILQDFILDIKAEDQKTDNKDTNIL